MPINPGRSGMPDQGSDMLTFKEYNKKYIIKPIEGPFSTGTVFWKTYDPVLGKLKTVSAQVNNESTPFKILEAADREVNGRGDPKYRSPFAPTWKYNYLVLYRETQDDPATKIWQMVAPKTVKDFLINTQNKTYTSEEGKIDETKLHFGLYWMLWFEVEKIRLGRNKEASKDTQYNITVLTEHLKGKVPAWMRQASVEFNYEKYEVIISKPGVESVELDIEKDRLFTLEQFDAIRDYTGDLMARTAPMSLEILQEKMITNPIAGLAEINGAPVYPNFERILDLYKQRMHELPPYSDEVVSDAPKIEEKMAEEAPAEPVEEKEVTEKSNRKTLLV